MSLAIAGGLPRDTPVIGQASIAHGLSHLYIDGAPRAVLLTSAVLMTFTPVRF